MQAGAASERSTPLAARAAARLARAELAVPVGRTILRYVSLRRLDLMGSGLFMVVIANLLLTWHRATTRVQLPYFDGSRHVAQVANLAASVRADGPLAVLPLFTQDPQNFLTYVFLMLPSLVLGSGRFAVGVAWVICLALILGAVWFLLRRDTTTTTRSLAVALLLFIGLLQAEQGGVWDTRIDVFSITLGFLMLTALVGGHLFTTLLLLLLAAYAKGAALPLLAPMVLAGFLSGHLRLGRPFWPRTLLKAAVLVAVGVPFFERVWPRAVSYNLMATRAADADSRVGAFLGSWWSYLSADPLFYGTQLTTDVRGWIVAVALGLLVLGIVRRWPASLLKLGGLSLVCFGYSYLLMTVSPLHSAVLAVWFFPALGLVALFIALAVARLAPAWLTAGLSIGLMAFVLGALPTRPAEPPVAYAAPIKQIFTQADGIARFLDAKFAGRSQRVLILTNFLALDGPVQHTADTYRALLQERLRRANLVIDGWELGTYGTDWRAEAGRLRGYPSMLLLVQERPLPGFVDRQQEAGLLFREEFETFRSQRPECFERAATAARLPKIGQQTAWLVSDDPTCRAWLVPSSPPGPNRLAPRK